MTSPSRTWALLAALAAGGVALALAVTLAVERSAPDVARASTFVPVPIPRLDVHQHVARGALPEALRLAGAHGIVAIVNQSGGPAGAGLEEAIEEARAHRGRSFVLANLELAGCCSGPWAAREAERVARARDLGARGIAVPVTLGPDAAGSGGAPTDVASALLDPVWSACARLRLPVVLHAREHLARPGADSGAAAIAAVAERHPRLVVIGAHLAGADAAALSPLLERLPNLWLDTAASVGVLAADPEAARAILLAHADRFLFGSDIRVIQLPEGKVVAFGAGAPGGRPEMLRFFDGTWRFFETRDPDVPEPVAAFGERSLRGVGLPRAVLEKIYRRNAERLLGVAVPEDVE